MYRQYGFQDKDLLLKTLVKDDTMTYFPEFNLLVVSSSYDPSEGLYNRTTAIFNARTTEIASGEFFKGCDYVSDMVFEGGHDKAFAVIDSFDRDADGSCWIDPRMSMLAGLFSWSPTIDAGSISDLVDAASYYQKHLMSDREGFELSHGRPLPDMAARHLDTGARELLDKLTSSETVSYFPEFNLLVTTTDFVPSGFHDHESAIFNVFPSELAYGKLFQGFENVADIPYSGPVVDPIALLSTFVEDTDEKRTADKSLRSLATLLIGADVISTKSVSELLDTMAERFGLEPEERTHITDRAQAKEPARLLVPDIGVEIDSQNDDDFITGISRMSICPLPSRRTVISSSWSCPWPPRRIWTPTSCRVASRASIRSVRRRPMRLNRCATAWKVSGSPCSMLLNIWRTTRFANPLWRAVCR